MPVPVGREVGPPPESRQDGGALAGLCRMRPKPLWTLEYQVRWSNGERVMMGGGILAEKGDCGGRNELNDTELVVLLGHSLGVLMFEYADGEGEVKNSGELAEVPTRSMHIPLVSPHVCTMYTL